MDLSFIILWNGVDLIAIGAGCVPGTHLSPLCYDYLVSFSGGG